MPNQNNQPQITQILNATIVTGTYQDKTTNTKKNAYLTIGTLFMYDNGGMSLKLDALPTNGQNIVFYSRKSKEHNQPNQNYQNQHDQNHGNGQNQQPYPYQNQG